MGATRKKAEAAQPVKIDPAAPPPMPAEVVVRGRASRPTFRRGGLVFGDRNWTPIDPAEVGPAAALAILADPVISIEGFTEGQWLPMPADIRAGLIEVLQGQLADATENPADSKAGA